MKAVNSSAISGTIRAPASKSVMIRAIAAALLSQGESRILNPSTCADSLAALRIARELGASTVLTEDRIRIMGTGKHMDGNPARNALDCGESGLCMRMFAPITSLSENAFMLKASGSLQNRSMKALDALSSVGVLCRTQDGYPPVSVKGPLKGGLIEIDGSQSSQFLTGLLMATPLCEMSSEIKVSNLKSIPYIEMTIDLLKKFGICVERDDRFTDFRIQENQEYVSGTFTVEGDWSGSAFLLIAGATAGCIEVTGLKLDSFQGDKAVIDVLKAAGAEVETKIDSVTVRKANLNAFEFDATHCPDLVPPLVALASHCNGRSVIHGIERLKEKESNRSYALQKEFSRLSIRIEVNDTRMEIHGGKPVGNIVDSHNDHRIAMACAIAALNGQRPVVIENYRCVGKSYPDFFRDIQSVQVKP